MKLVAVKFWQLVQIILLTRSSSFMTSNHVKFQKLLLTKALGLRLLWSVRGVSGLSFTLTQRSWTGRRRVTRGRFGGVRRFSAWFFTRRIFLVTNRLQFIARISVKLILLYCVLVQMVCFRLIRLLFIVNSRTRVRFGVLFPILLFTFWTPLGSSGPSFHPIPSRCWTRLPLFPLSGSPGRTLLTRLIQVTLRRPQFLEVITLLDRRLSVKTTRLPFWFRFIGDDGLVNLLFILLVVRFMFIRPTTRRTTVQRRLLLIRGRPLLWWGRVKCRAHIRLFTSVSVGRRVGGRGRLL